MSVTDVTARTCNLPRHDVDYIRTHPLPNGDNVPRTVEQLAHDMARDGLVCEIISTVEFARPLTLDEMAGFRLKRVAHHPALRGLLPGQL